MSLRILRPFALAFTLSTPLYSNPSLTSQRTLTTCPASAPHCRLRMAATSPATSADPALITGPSWKLEYDSVEDVALLDDLAEAEKAMAAMSQTGTMLKPFVPVAANLTNADIEQNEILDKLVSMFHEHWKANVLLRNVATYASCVSSVDGTHGAAKRVYAKVQELFAKCRTLYEPAALMLDLSGEELFERFLETDEETKAAEYVLRHGRKMAKHRLTLEEENIVTSLSVTGYSSWGTLYSDLSSVLTVRMEGEEGSGTKEMGIATAEAMRDSPDEGARRRSWEGIREAWLPHQESCAAILNAITGWRLDLYEKRGYESFLNASLHANRMSGQTLKALLEAVERSVEVGRRALRIQAKGLRKEALDVWDLFAPAPRAGTGRIYTFDEGIELIAQAVGKVDEEGGKFVRMMKEEGWIEASRGDKKKPGA